MTRTPALVVLFLIGLTVLTVHAESTDPKVLERAPLTFPEAAEAAGHQGTAKIRLLVLPDGTIGQATVERSSHSSLLDQAALDSVRRWRYSPALDDQGHPVAASFAVDFDFKRPSRFDDPRKPCADLVTEVDWLTANVPDFNAATWAPLRFEFPARVPPFDKKAADETLTALAEKLASAVALCRLHPQARARDATTYVIEDQAYRRPSMLSAEHEAAERKRREAIFGTIPISGTTVPMTASPASKAASAQ